MPHLNFSRASSATFLCGALACGLTFGPVPSGRGATERPQLNTRHVLLVTTDGFRWQELFGGAEGQLLDQTNSNIKNISQLRRQFGGRNPETRREALLPFFWNTIAKEGQLWGNTNRGSVV